MKFNSKTSINFLLFAVFRWLLGKMQGNLKIPFILLIVLASAALISSGFAPFVPASRAKAVDDDALTKLRDLMKGTSTIEPLVAYIIPTDDAHQVCPLILNFHWTLRSKTFRANTSPHEIVVGSLSLDSPAQLERQW